MLNEKLEELFSKKEVSKTGKFLLALAISFFSLSLALSLVPLEWTEYFFATLSLFVLSFFGVHGEIVFGEPVLLMLSALSLPISISYLCTGLLEAAIIVSATISSFGISFKKRIFGALGGIVTLAVFNVARITASILIIIFAGLDVAAFSHDVLFRVFLFVTVAGYYYAWFAWAAKEK
ncbi:MAG: exosortase/archaeosortase family protein [Candidatus Diapherotrites archaeon]|nr:exosortase/archaeosortase family protein [Candidatus Diapherotrites archaeon]